MIFNRRDLLKAFGVGATVVPVIGGVPEIATPAKLIEVPKLEPVTLEKSSGPFLGGERCAITVDIVTETGKHFRFEAESFDVSVSRRMIDVTDYRSRDPYPRMAPGPFAGMFTLSGTFDGDGKLGV